MQKAQLIEKILAVKTEMEPLAIEWAKVTKKKFAARFENLDNMTMMELQGHYARLKAIYTGTWADLKKTWDRLPEPQWRNTFLLEMKHLPEYTDLKTALIAFKQQFMGKKKKIKD